MSTRLGQAVAAMLLLIAVTACFSTPTPPPTPAPVPETATPSATEMFHIVPTKTPIPPPTATPVATVTPQPEPTTGPLPTDTPDPDAATLNQIPSRPIRNPVDLATRFGRLNPNAKPAGGPSNVGDVDQFWVLTSSEPPQKEQRSAQLRYQSEHVNWWVDEDFSVPQEDIIRAAEYFEQSTYPTNRNLFGSEAIPGVDNDPRLHVFMGRVPGVLGYFYAANQFPQSAVDYSNQREMFLINLQSLKPADPYFDQVLAHEFQHMIHWNNDPNETSWINEGLSELAEYLNKFGPSSFTANYLQAPDLQLTNWSSETNNRYKNYGASFLFARYLEQRFGRDFIKALVAEPADGIDGITATLANQGFDADFNPIFLDFLTELYLAANGQQSETFDFDVSDLASAATFTSANLPVSEMANVQQYGVDYLIIEHRRPLTITVQGVPSATLIGNLPDGVSEVWHSNRGDTLNSRLWRTVDLRSVETATLNFDTWYAIEPDWDYAYIIASADNGRTWQILATADSTTTNPSGNAYGPGYTGVSQGWRAQTIDLSAFAGREILLGFEYITDDAVNRSGFAVTNIQIPEIDYHWTDGQGDWQADGFFRTDNQFSQGYLLRVIEQAASTAPTVRDVTFNPQNLAVAVLNGAQPGQETTRSTVIVSAFAPLTINAAPYQYTLQTGE